MYKRQRKTLALMLANNSGVSRKSELLSRTSLYEDFTYSDTLDSRITATRASTKTYFDSTGTLQTAAINEFPREYDPVTLACRGRSFWEARTNLLTYSEQFDNAAWTKTRSSITANATTAPDGTVTADKLVEDSTATNTHPITGFVSGTAPNQTLSFSVYIKAGERSWIRGLIWDAGAPVNQVAAYFDLSSGVVGTVANGGGGTGATASISSVGNGWYRCTVTGKPNTAGTNSGVAIYLSTADNVVSYTGDGSSGLYLWGAQLEAGATPTPYIPTTSASVTRSADVVSMTGTNFSSWYNQTEGTILFTGSKPGSVASGEFPTLFAISAGAAITNEHSMYFPQVATQIYNLGISGGANQYNLLLGSLSQGSAFTATTAYKANDIGGTLNGAAVTTDASATIPATMDRLTIGARGTVAQWLNGFISRIVYWPVRLPNTDLQILSRST